MTITPIKATIHYDDTKKLWLLKASRQEVESPNDIKPWVDVIEDVINLSQLIILLLQFWASAGSTVNAPIGDMRALSALIGPMEGTFTEEVADWVPGTPEFPGSTFTDPPYDGISEDWGVTV